MGLLLDVTIGEAITGGSIIFFPLNRKSGGQEPHHHLGLLSKDLGSLSLLFCHPWCVNFILIVASYDDIFF